LRYGFATLTVLVAMFMFQNIGFSQEFDFFEPHTTLGGYGEVHYNYSKTEDGISKKILDFHRFIVFFGYAWTEEWSFKSELELEHNLVEEGIGSNCNYYSFLVYSIIGPISIPWGNIIKAIAKAIIDIIIPYIKNV